jgi:hypothetical protein
MDGVEVFEEQDHANEGGPLNVVVALLAVVGQEANVVLAARQTPVTAGADVDL